MSRPSMAQWRRSSADVGGALLASVPDRTFDAMQLNKLAYLVVGRAAIGRIEPLCRDMPGVWEHGPIMTELYELTTGYVRARRGDGLGGLRRLPSRLPGARPVPREVADLAARVAGEAGHLGGIALSEVCHARGSAWRTYAEAHGYRVRRGAEIPHEMLRRCFALDPAFGYRALALPDPPEDRGPERRPGFFEGLGNRLGDACDGAARALAAGLRGR